MTHPKVGDRVQCVETKKWFNVESHGCTFNYATNEKGEVLSDEGVDIREKRELLDRSKPFTAYLSDAAMYVTGWKGNKLGTVVRHTTASNSFGGSTLHYVRVRDVHGNLWHGKNAGPGMIITLRPMKG